MPRHLRVARPVSDLARAEEMYTRGLGYEVLGRFADHAGFDGVMLGDPGGIYHLEFTYAREHPITPTPTVDDLLVLYIPADAQWHAACASMLAAGFRHVPSFNPYWDERGKTFEDPDRYRVVLVQEAWRHVPRS
jgi:catechol 2,3-dioxygenase-like lactoylglutathione lyase family enzyme